MHVVTSFSAHLFEELFQCILSLSHKEDVLDYHLVLLQVHCPDLHTQTQTTITATGSFMGTYRINSIARLKLINTI